MLVDTCTTVTARILRVPLGLIGSQRFAGKIGHRLVQQPGLACDLQVLTDSVRQPQQIIGTSRADTALRTFVPPVQNIAFGKLDAASTDDLVAGELGLHVQEGKRILQLIAEAEAASRLVQACSAPQPPGQILIEEPAIEQVIERFVGCANTTAIEHVVPVSLRFCLAIADVLPGMRRLGKHEGCITVVGRAECEADFSFLTGGKIHVNLVRATGLGAGDDFSRQSNSPQCCRTAWVAGSAEEFAPVRREAM